MVYNFKDELENYIGRMGGGESASNRSIFELDSLKQETLQVASISSGSMRPGKMFMFRYYTPDEPIYDTYPIIISLGPNRNNNLVGVNLHYIPYRVRVQFVADFFHFYETYISPFLVGASTMNVNLQTGFPIHYNEFKRVLAERYRLFPAIREYRYDRMMNITAIAYESWHIPVTNDQNYFYGSTIDAVQSRYYS